MAKSRKNNKLRIVQSPGVNISAIARTFLVNQKTVRNWKAKGCPLHLGDDEIRRWLDTHAAKKREKMAVSAPKELDRKRAIEAELAELRLQTAKGTLVPVQRVRDELARLCEQIKIHSRAMVDELCQAMGADSDGRQRASTARAAFLRRVAQAMDAGQVRPDRSNVESMTEPAGGAASGGSSRGEASKGARSRRTPGRSAATPAASPRRR